MVTSVRTKVGRLLEATGGAGDECPRCEWGGGDDNHTYQLTWIDPGRLDDREEFCAECGRQLVYVLTWGDEV